MEGLKIARVTSIVRFETVFACTIHISNKNGTPGDRNIGEFYSSSTNLGSIPLPCFIVSFLFNDLALTLNLRGQMMCSNFFVYLNIFKVITLSLFS